MPSTNKIPRHVCQVCRMGFHRASHLERHTKTHLAYKEYFCVACGRDFVRRDNLMRHQRMFHPGVEFDNTDGKDRIECVSVRLETTENDPQTPYKSPPLSPETSISGNLSSYGRLDFDQTHQHGTAFRRASECEYASREQSPDARDSYDRSRPAPQGSLFQPIYATPLPTPPVDAPPTYEPRHREYFNPAVQQPRLPWTPPASEHGQSTPASAPAQPVEQPPYELYHHQQVPYLPEPAATLFPSRTLPPLDFAAMQPMQIAVGGKSPFDVNRGAGLW